MDTKDIRCRFCAEQKIYSDLLDLHPDSDLKTKVKLQLAYFNIDYIDLSAESPIPKYICNTCLHLLNTAYDFFVRTKQSQATLNEIFAKGDSNCYEIKTEVSTLDIKIKNELSPAHSESDEVLSHFLIPYQGCADDSKSIDYSDIKPSLCHCGIEFTECTICYYGKRHKKGKKRKSEKVKKIKRQKQEKADESWAGYTWECQICDTEYCDISDLRAHTRSAHNKCFAINCSDCSDVLESYTELIVHIRWHRLHLRYYCHYCNHRYKKVNEELKHITVHHADSQEVCEGCGEIFPNKDLYQLHIDTYNPPKPRIISYKKRDKPITIEDLTCNICFKVSKSIGNLKIHKQMHTERTRNFTCEVCGSAFYTKGVLQSHSVVHQSIDPAICKICGKTFKTLIRLKKHLKTHYAEKPYKCDQCNRGFRLKEQLKNHMIIHTDEIPFPCPYCSKGFKFKSVLTTHLNQHTGVKPYACTECTMDFSSWSNCNKHMKRKHSKTLAKNVLTPHGRVPVNEDGTPKILTNLDCLKDIEKDIGLLQTMN